MSLPGLVSAQVTYGTPHLVRTVTAPGGTEVDGDGPAGEARFNQPGGVVKDTNGVTYVADTGNHKIRRISSAGVVSTFAGTGAAGAADGAGASATFNGPTALALDEALNLYVADTGNHKIRKITPGGTVSTFAGTGTAGYANGIGTAAAFNSPRGLAFGMGYYSATKALFVSDTLNHRIREIVMATGEVKFYAGSTTPGEANGPLYSCSFNEPHGLAYNDYDRSFCVADTGNHRIRKIGSEVTTLAGGTAGYADGTTTAARFTHPVGITVGQGIAERYNRYVVEAGGNRVRLVGEGGVVTTVAGSGLPGMFDGAAATAKFSAPRGIFRDTDGTLLVADTGNSRIRTVAAGQVATLAGRGNNADLLYPKGMALAGGRLYIADYGNQRIAVMDGNGFISSMSATPVEQPRDVAVDGAGNAYVADGGRRILKVTPQGVVSVFAGTGTEALVDGAGEAASFVDPEALAWDGGGNLVVADRHSLRKITPAGVVTTFAGSAVPGFVNDTGTTARFQYVKGIAVGADGTIYVAEYGSQAVRKVSPAGVVTTLAGNGMSDWVDGTGTAARFIAPMDVAVDAAGTVLLLEGGYDAAQGLFGTRLRSITAGGVVTTVAGGQNGGDVDGAGAAARFYGSALAPGPDGTFYMADLYNQKIRRVDAGGGQTITFAPIPDQVYGAGALTLSATASSGLPVGYTVVAGNAVVAGNTVTPAAAGVVTVRAVQAGDSYFSAAAPVERSFTVVKAAQTITFPTVATLTPTVPSAVLAATATSGLAVAYEIVSGPGSLSGSTLTRTGTGTIRVRATQAGNGNFNAAAAVERDVISAEKTPQSITFTLPTWQELTNPTLVLPGTASSGLPVSYEVVSGPGSVEGGTLTLLGEGLVTVRATQAGNATYTAATPREDSISAVKAIQSITFNGPGTQYLTTSTITLSATASSGLPVTFEVLSGNAVVNGTTLTLPTVAGSVTVRAKQAGNNVYMAANNTDRTFNVAKAPQTITFTTPGSRTYGSGIFMPEATASSGLQVVFSVVSGPGTMADNVLTITGAGYVVIAANQPGNAFHAAAPQVQRTLTVNKANQTINFPALPPQSMANPTVQLVATSSSGLPVTFEKMYGSGTINGSTVTLTAADPFLVRASQVGDANYNPAPQVDREIISGKVGQTITFDLPFIQTLDNPTVNLVASSTSGLPVTFTRVSGPATLSGSTLTLTGEGMVKVRASQAGNSTYGAAASVERDILAAKRPHTIDFISVGPVNVNSGTVTLAAISSLNLPVTFARVSGTAATVSGNKLTVTGEGTVVLSASHPGSSTTAAAYVEQQVVITKVPQTINFAPIGDRTLESLTVPLSATASTGLSVTFSVLSGAASVSGSTLTLQAVEGQVRVRARQAGNTTYALTDVEQVFNVTKAVQTINFPEVANKTMPASFYLGATSSSSLAVSYTVNGPASHSLGTLTLTGAGTVTVTASQSGNARYLAATPVVRSFQVAKGTQTAALSFIADRVFSLGSGRTFTLPGSLSSSLPPVYAVVDGPATVSGSNLTITGAGPVTVSASHPGNDGYEPAAAVTRTFTVTPSTVQQLVAYNEQGGVLLDGYSVPFGYMNYGYPVVKWITLTNRTTRPLTNLEYVFSGPAAADFQFLLEPMEIPANSSVVVPVSFSTEVRGTRTAQLVIRDRTQDADSYLLNLSGEIAVDARFTDGQVLALPKSTVMASFRLTTPEGEGLDYPDSIIQAPGFFSFLEDNAVPPGEVHMQVGKATGIPTVTRTVILIDNSLAMATRMAAAKAAAKALVEHATPNQEFAVYCFSESVLKRQGFTKNKTTLNAAIDGIPATNLLSGRNLYGAMIQGLGEWTDSVSLTSVTRGSLVVLTGGQHTTGGLTQAEVLAARGTKRIHTIALGTSYDYGLAEVSNAGVIPSPTAGELEYAFSDAQERILKDERSLYLLSYISPKRGAQNHTLTIHLAENLNRGNGYYYSGTFSSSGFTSEQSEVVVNRDILNPRGVSSLALNGSGPFTAQAFTILPADQENPPAYTWSVNDPQTLSIQSSGGTVTITPLRNGTARLTVTDTVNQPYGSFYSKTVDVVVTNYSTVTYTGWLSQAGLTGGNAQMGATPHRDGVPNLLKYAFNLDGSGPDCRSLTPGGTAGLPVVTLDTSVTPPLLKIEYLRRKNSGLTYTPQRSTALDGFTTFTGQQTVTSINAAWERVVVSDSSPVSGTNKGFARVAVTGQ